MDELDVKTYNFLYHWLSNRGESHQVNEILNKTKISQLYYAIGCIKDGSNDKEQIIRILTKYTN